MEHASVGVSELNFRLFRMSYKATSNLRCFFNTIFCLFNFQQSQENPPQSLLQSDMGEDWSASESESEYTEHSSDTGNMKFWDGNDIRFIRTRSWVSTSKRELLNFATWKKKSSPVFSFCVLHHSGISTFISRQRKIASRDCILHNSIGNIGKCSKYKLLDATLTVLFPFVLICSLFYGHSILFFFNGWLLSHAKIKSWVAYKWKLK